MIQLEGKKALVTGAGRGIGREIALTLAKAGADIGVCDIDLTLAQSTAEEIQSLGRNSIPLRCDVSKSSEISETVSAFCVRFSTIDILVNNAGITRDNLLVRMKEEDWDLVLTVNLKSAFLCCKEAAKVMMKSRCGKIVNIASIVGITGNAGQANYSASKAGLIGLTKSLAKEFASRNIQVNAVAPGFIKTAMTDKLSDADKEKLISQIPMQRMGLPQDVANVVLFLSSSLSDYITGQVITVDGGMVM
jgi:3-oxoacyl-[acyl-carrier protein] reductase